MIQLDWWGYQITRKSKVFSQVRGQANQDMEVKVTGLWTSLTCCLDEQMGDDFS